jgi:tetratricopeptide (TPR) repeat protein
MASTARIDELRKKFDDNPRRYFAPLANELRKAGDLEQAIALCRAHLPQQSGHISGHIVLAQALFEANELDEATHVFEQALDLDPENLIALRSLGDIARSASDTAAARSWYERVLEVDPRNEEIVELIRNLPEPQPEVPQVEERDPAPATASVAEAETESDDAAREPEPAASPVAEEPFFAESFVDLAASTPTETSWTPAEPIPAIEEPAEPALAEWTQPGSLDEWDTAAGDATLLDFGARGGTPARSLTPQGFSSLSGLDIESEAESFSPASELAVDDTFHARLQDGELDAVADPLLDDWLDPTVSTQEPPQPEPQSEAPVASMSLESEDDLLAAFEDYPLEVATRADDPLGFDDATSTTDSVVEEHDEPSWMTASAIDHDDAGAFDEPLVSAMATAGAEPNADLAPEPERTPRFTPVVQDATPAPSVFVTETMAELYLQQGFTQEALGIYRQLLAQNPGDASLKQRVAQLEAGADTSLDIGPRAAAPTPVEVEAVAPTPAPPSAQTVRAFFGGIARKRVGSEDNASSAAAPAADVATAEAPPGDDIEEFTAWLEGLNKP